MRYSSLGFTLIELMVVMVLIGVLASMVHISLGDNRAREARQEANVMLALMQGLREKAVLEGQEYGLRLEPEAYQLMQLQDDIWQAIEPTVKMPSGVVLTLILEGRSQNLAVGEWTPQLWWLSSDENTPFALHFDSPPLRWQSLYSDGLGNPLLEAFEATNEG